MSVWQIPLPKFQSAAGRYSSLAAGAGELGRGHATLTSTPGRVYKQSIHKEDP